METITLSTVYLQVHVVRNFSTLSRVLGEGVGVTLSPLKKALAFNNVNRDS